MSQSRCHAGPKRPMLGKTSGFAVATAEKCCVCVCVCLQFSLFVRGARIKLRVRVHLVGDARRNGNTVAVGWRCGCCLSPAPDRDNPVGCLCQQTQPLKIHAAHSSARVRQRANLRPRLRACVCVRALKVIHELRLCSAAAETYSLCAECLYVFWASVGGL